MSCAFEDGSYFGPDKREITPAGIAHVMRAFAETYAGRPDVPPISALATGSAYTAAMEALMRVHCDELALDQG